MKTHSKTNSSRRDFIRQSAVATAGLMVAPAHLAGAEQPKETLAKASVNRTFRQIPGFATLPDNHWPGRLVVGGQTLDDFVAIAEEPSPDAGWTVRLFQSVSVPELQIHAQWRTIGAVTEWIPTLVNNAPKPSGKVTEVRSLAAAWPTRGPVDFTETRGRKRVLMTFLIARNSALRWLS